MKRMLVLGFLAVSGTTVAATPLQIYEYVKKGFDEGRQRAEERMAAQAALQNQLLEQQSQSKKKQQEAAASIGRAWLSTADATSEQRRDFYETFIVPQSKAAGLSLPEQYDPSMLDMMAKAYIAMLESD
ncbi:hypothetical protein XFPR_01425 [Xylella fastidiosa]|uniref:Uncharacterized protein n=2 Tax=Xylella fastidiosa TaxID=2371 RepID=A0ABC8ABJ5_XYLFS|nr:hypothetical protein [Xylella fastidiosa]AAF83138.1 hypothetical protein XF_0328 [Xylella fastidiosa 9a5c]ALQ94027.1 hypothetical protein XFUD_01430 [Xylella fastidiosa]ALQ96270.1 hypothetical protein XFC3_01430 [Xylella fastidiosa]ALR01120.1 hypothetical protein OY18_01425 [Xylella fastidiosa]ALR03501.1 hypothetical protein XFPR_01425 [Xylella fastidiosa]